MIHVLHIRELVVWNGNADGPVAVCACIIRDAESGGCRARLRIKVVAFEEIRLQAFPVPAAVSELRPGVVVGVGAAVELHAVYEGAAAYDVADCDEERLVAEIGDGRTVDVVHGGKVEAAGVAGDAGECTVAEGTVFNHQDRLCGWYC